MSGADQVRNVSIRLQTLGGLSVLVDGAEDSALSAQPTRSGVLTYLAIEREATRGHLTSLVWPTSDPRLARRALAQTIFMLREQFGRGWIERPGDRVTVTSDLTVDASDFLAAVDEGRHVDAIDLYSGPFLDGLSLVKTPEFEAWSESRRSHMASQFRDAVCARIDELKLLGDAEGVFALARKWVDCDALDEDANYVLVETLADLGRRSQALRHFEQFERLLKGTGLGGVSARIDELQGRIRTSTPEPIEAVGPPPSEASDVALAEIGSWRGLPDVAASSGESVTSVAVVPFESLSVSTGDEYLAEGLTDEVVSRLTRLDRMRVVPRSSVAAYRDVAYRPALLGPGLGVDAILEGSVQQDGDHIRVRVRLISVADDSYVWQKGFDAPVDQILQLQSDIAEGMATTLSTRLTRREQSLVRTPPTSSATAWLHFGRALSDLALETDEGLGRAIASLERAIEEDPDFSAALARLTDAYARSDQRRKLANFQGRDAELQQLSRLVDNASDGSGGFVVVAGRAGMGKTSLILKLRESLPPEHRFFMGVCRARGKTSPFLPFAQALREALGIGDGATSAEIESALAQALTDLDPTLRQRTSTYRHLLGLGEGRHIDPDAGAAEELRQGIVDGLLELLRAMSSTNTVVLVLEDWQWADEGSRVVLTNLARSIEDERALLLVTHRSEHALEWPGLDPVRLHLNGLSESDADELICTDLGTEDVSERLSSLIRARTDGNPFYIDEFCRTLADEGMVGKEDGVAELRGDADRLPTDINQILHARIDRLDRTADEASTLAVLAVLGRDASIPFLRHLTNSDQGLLPSLARLRALDLVQAIPGRGESVLRVKHDITQDVALASSHSRADLHQRVGRALEELYAEGRLDEHLEELAYHFSESDDHERASNYLEAAGDRAFRSFSLLEARQYYRRAIKVLERDQRQAARRAEVSFKWAEAGMQAASVDQIDVLQRSYSDAHELGDPSLVVRCSYWLGWVYYALGNQRESVRMFERCREMAERSQDTRFAAQVYLNLAYNYAASTEYELAIEYFEQGAAMREALPGEQRARGLAYAYGLLAMIHSERGDPGAASAWLERAFEIAQLPERRSLEGSMRTQEAFTYAFQHEWERCKETAASIRTIAAEIGGSFIGALGLTLQGYASVALGEGGLDLLRQGVAQLEETRAFLYMSWNYAALADALARQGQGEEATSFALKSLARGTVHDRLGEPLAKQALARVEAAKPHADWSLVRSHLDEAISACEGRGSSRGVVDVRLCHAELLATAGSVAEASERLEQALELLTPGMPAYEREAERIRALIVA